MFPPRNETNRSKTVSCSDACLFLFFLLRPLKLWLRWRDTQTKGQEHTLHTRARMRRHQRYRVHFQRGQRGRKHRGTKTEDTHSLWSDASNSRKCTVMHNTPQSFNDVTQGLAQRSATCRRSHSCSKDPECQFISNISAALSPPKTHTKKTIKTKWISCPRFVCSEIQCL